MRCNETAQEFVALAPHVEPDARIAAAQRSALTTRGHSLQHSEAAQVFDPRAQRIQPGTRGAAAQQKSEWRKGRDKCSTLKLSRKLARMRCTSFCC